MLHIGSTSGQAQIPGTQTTTLPSCPLAPKEVTADAELEYLKRQLDLLYA
jgi:hypothetical protein